MGVTAPNRINNLREVSGEARSTQRFTVKCFPLRSPRLGGRSSGFTIVLGCSLTSICWSGRRVPAFPKLRRQVDGWPNRALQPTSGARRVGASLRRRLAPLAVERLSR